MAKAVIAFVLLSAAPVRGSTFLSAHPKVEMQSLPTQELEQLLLSELASIDSDARLDVAAAELRPLYAVLPKNVAGKLDPTVVRYALHRFFASKYGWHLRGLEPGVPATNASVPATIMKDRAPSYIMDIFEQRLHGRGLGLRELAVFAVTLSDLVHKEAVSDLEDIFAVMGLSRSERLSDAAVARLVKVYLMTYITGAHTPKQSSNDFAKMEADIVDRVIVWFEAKMWGEDTHLALSHALLSRRNPFVNEFSFEYVAEVAREMGHRFGDFQNLECKSLKDKLVDMDHSGSGRVPLSLFYSGIEHQDWPFIESAEYLRTLGALDESDPKMPSVIIANFLGSPSNCIAPSNFYSVCCIDECEGLLSQVEAAIAEPSVTPLKLVEVVSRLQSDTVAAPRNLSSAQIARLGDIATHHGGQVPLHGRLFAQWMHHAYPRECRFPHVAGSTSPRTQQDFANEFGLEAEASDEEIAQYIERDTPLEPLVVDLPWTSEEELIAAHRKLDEGAVQLQPFRSVRTLAVIVAVVMSAGVPAFRAKSRAEQFFGKQERHLV